MKPVASNSVAPGSLTAPTPTIRPSEMATSAGRAGPPVPSMTVPDRIT